MKNPLHTLIVLLLILLSFGPVSAQGTDESIRIENPDTDTVFYCGDPIAVAPDIIIENFIPQKPSDGIKISIVDYIPGEDTLRYTGTDETGISAAWNDSVGNLEITGLKTDNELQEAVRQVYYENLSDAAATGIRSISISMMDADYLPATGHFYQYVDSLDITWTEARDAAENMYYHELQGYLATITSSVENDFIWSKIDGMGWIGASDKEVNHKWKWVTGPEADSLFWEGDFTGQPFEGSYANWSEGEPNDDWGEGHYAHINQDPNKKEKSWNDLPNEGGGGVYRSRGFVVEFGTPDDSLQQLSASAVVMLHHLPEEPSVGFDTLICGELVQQLQIDIDADVFPILYPLDSNALVYQETSLSPVVEVKDYGRYRFVLQTYYKEQCSRFDTIEIAFQHQPVARLNVGDDKCADPDIQISFEGEVDGDAFFYWYSNDTLVDSGLNIFSPGINLDIGPLNPTIALKVMENGCSDSIRIPVAVKPTVEISADNTEGCTPLDVQFNSRVSEGIDEFFWSFGNEVDSTVANPSFTFHNPDTTDKTFDVSLRVVSAEGCESSDTIENMIRVHPEPTVDIGIDESVCYEGNEEIWYSGTVSPGDTFIWDLSDVPAEDIVQHPGSSAGPLQLNLTGSPVADIGLQVVSEFGCKSDALVKTFKRKPYFSISADNTEGCTPLNVQFNSSVYEGVDEFLWSFGNEVDSAAVANPSITFHNPDTTDKTFDVSLRVVSAEGCESSDTIENMIRVHPEPTVDIGIDESICYEGNEEIWYSGTVSPGDTFIWDLTDVPAEDIVQHPGSSAGPLQLNLTGSPVADIGLQVVSEFGCKSDALAKTFKRKPSFGIPADTIAGCPPLDVILSVGSDDVTDQVEYLWDLGNGQTAGGPSVSQVYSGENRFFDVAVYGVSSFTGCADTLMLPGKIHVYPLPEASFSADPTTVLVTDSEIYFENTSSGAVRYEWDYGDNSFGSTIENPVHRYDELGLFNVTLLAENEFGCTDSAFTQITVNFDKLFPPTAFSPNAAREEDRRFTIYAEGIVKEGYKLLIFNRWGEMIFTTQTPEEGWNGKMKNGSNAPAGTYFWIVEYLDSIGEEHSQKGSLTLLY